VYGSVYIFQKAQWRTRWLRFARVTVSKLNLEQKNVLNLLCEAVCRVCRPVQRTGIFPSVSKQLMLQ
jgi:hypothetical protein